MSKYEILFILTLPFVIATCNNNTTEPQPAAQHKIVFSSIQDDQIEQIYVINADGTNQTRLTLFPATDSWFPVWSPDGSKIAFYNGDQMDIYTVDADGSNLQNLTDNPAAVDSRPAWSPDGSRIAFRSNRDGNWEVYIMDIDGSNQQNLTRDPETNGSPVWSPDGSKIAYTGVTNDTSRLYLMNADGTNQVMLNGNSFHAHSSPAWSADGLRLAFVSGTIDVTTWEIFTIDVDGGNLLQWTNNNAIDGEPVWSPDGAKIAFSSGQDKFDAIYVVDVVRKTQEKLTSDTDAWQPLWSPDGKSILYLSKKHPGSPQKMYLMNFDGSGKKRLTTNNDVVLERYPAWSPVLLR